MTLARQAVAELVGTAFLLMAVVGSGIAAERLAPGEAGLQLLVNSLATGSALAVLIVALHPVSASFNPVVTVVERLAGTLGTAALGILLVAQLAGAVVGVVIANLMFGLDVVSIATTERGAGGLWIGEVVATGGLVLVVLSTARYGRVPVLAASVGAYITAAYWFTSSTSFANPAVTVARTLSDTFTGIAPKSVPMFVLMQLVGAALAVGLLRLLYPRPTGAAS